MEKSDKDLIRIIMHYKESILKYSSEKNLNEQKLVHCIGKLYNIPVKIAHLEETKIGLTVNGLRKLGGEVSDAAKSLIAKWKKMVLEESDSRQEQDTKGKDMQDSISKSDLKKEEKVHREHEKLEKIRSKSSHSGSNYKSDQKEKLEANSSKNSKQMLKDHHVHTEKYKHHGHNAENSSKRKYEDSSDSDDDEYVKSKHRKHHSKQKYSSHSASDDASSDVKHSSESSCSELEESNIDKHESRRGKTSHHHRSMNEANGFKAKQKSGHHEKEHSDKKESKHKRKEDGSHLKDSDDRSKLPSSTKHVHKKTKLDQRETMDEKSKKRIRTDDSNENSSKMKAAKHDSRKSRGKSSGKDEQKSSHNALQPPQKEKKKKDDKCKSSESKSKSSAKITESGIGSGSGASFAEALGMLEPSSSKTSPKKKAVVSSPSRKEKSSLPSKSKEEVLPPSLLKEPPKLEQLDINISSLLPAITPNYRPLGNLTDNIHQRSKVLLDDEALSKVMSSKNQRTKVYSGNKSAWGVVPSLFELCTRILQDNIDALEYTGGVPYIILKPVLERATPDQLFTLEHHNPYLIEDTDELWYLHCLKQFKNKRREELESWREMYMRCLDEREAKLAALTANIKQSQDKSLPVRQTKLAYVDSFVKPPREIAKRQAKNGIKPVITPSARLATLVNPGGAAGQVIVPNPGPRAADRSGSSSAYMKPKKAPLMQKALALIKNRFKR